MNGLQLLQAGRLLRSVGRAGKKPAEFGSGGNDPVIIEFGGHPLCVLRCAAAGHAEGQLVPPQQGRGPCGVGAVLVHLNGGEQVAHPQQIRAQLAGDEPGRRESGEHAVGVLVAQGNGLLLPGQRVATAEDKEMTAPPLPGLNLLVQAVELHIGPHAVDGRAAAAAAHLAGKGGVDDHRPGGAAVPQFPRRVAAGPVHQPGVNHKVLKNLFQHPAVDIGIHALDEAVPVVAGVTHGPVKQLPVG